MFSTPARSHNKGFTLIELVIVLGVVGIVFGGIFVAWGSVNSQSKLRKMQDQITVIVNQVRSTYGNRNSMENATGPQFTNALVNSGLIPESWMVGSNVGNPYGGTVVMDPGTVGTRAANCCLSIALTNVPRADCYKLASAMLSVGRSQGLILIDAAAITSASTFSSIRSQVCTATTTTYWYELKTNN